MLTLPSAGAWLEYSLLLRDIAVELARLISYGARQYAIGARKRAISIKADAARAYRTFVTPLDREDIHRLISRMDDVLDLIQESPLQPGACGTDPQTVQ